MKLSTWAWAFTLFGCLLVGNAMAQGLRQPFSVRPAGFDYNRYLQEDAASPSDQPAPAVEAQSVQQDTVAIGTGIGFGTNVTGAFVASGGAGDCCNSCGASACDGSACGGGCGFGCLGDLCCLGEKHTISSHLFDKCSPWSVGGWTQFGYTNKSTLLFNNVPGKVNLHQQWFYLERTANPTASSWDWGFRADLLYGIDAADTQAFGNPLGSNGRPQGWDTGWNQGEYGWALPQLYGEIAYGDVSVKVGHFYTLVGYEVVAAPQNFFYSHSFTQYNSEPFTHTGAVATYSVNDQLDVYGGWTLGWDTGFEQFGSGSSFLGGFSASLTEGLNLAYITTIGDLGWRGDDGYMHSVVVNAHLTGKLNYIFQSDYLKVNSTGEDNFGINQYLIYTVNDCVGVGTRVEWWKTDPLGVVATNGNVSVYEATFGVNLRPHANFVVRPEIRQNWAPAANYDETILGVDVVATY